MSERGAVLRIDDVTLKFGGIVAIKSVTFEAQPSELLALVGPNGAGKTALLNCISGIYRPTSGNIFLDGASIVGEPLHRKVKLGVGRAFQHAELFPELERLLKRRAGLLSGGEQKMLALASGLASDPKLLLVDELSLGLAPLVVERLLTSLDEARSRGVAVVLVEQQLQKALAIADRAYVLRRGQVELQGTTAELRERVDELRSQYINRSGVSPASDIDAPGREQR